MVFFAPIIAAVSYWLIDRQQYEITDNAYLTWILFYFLLIFTHFEICRLWL